MAERQLRMPGPCTLCERTRQAEARAELSEEQLTDLQKEHHDCPTHLAVVQELYEREYRHAVGLSVLLGEYREIGGDLADRVQDCLMNLAEWEHDSGEDALAAWRGLNPGPLDDRAREIGALFREMGEFLEAEEIVRDQGGLVSDTAMQLLARYRAATGKGHDASHR